MWGVVIAVVFIGLIVAAIAAARRPTPDPAASQWGTPAQAKVLVIMLVVLAVAIVWAISANRS